MPQDTPAGNGAASRAGCRGNAVLCVPHVRNNPLNLTDPTGHMETSGCQERDCTLGGQINPDVTYRTADGTYTVSDPTLAAKYPSVIAQKVNKVMFADA